MFDDEQYKHRIGIIGAGIVGTACELGFSSMPETEVLVHDKFKPTDSLERVVEDSDILFLCLPTPSGGDDGSCDTSFVESVAAKINRIATSKKNIVVKSTVPPGTTARLSGLYSRHLFCFNPEFLTQKNYVQDFADQTLIILGSDSFKGSKVLPFYQDFISHQKRVKAEIFLCSFNEAEMAKYTINTFLAAKVSFFNEIYEICQKSNVDYDYMIKIIQKDARLGTSHMQVPGPDNQFGFSGACFPKDIQALIAYAESKNVSPLMLESAWASNILRREQHDSDLFPEILNKVHKACS